MIESYEVLRVSIPFLHLEKVPAVVTVSMSVEQIHELIGSLQKAIDDGLIPDHEREICSRVGHNGVNGDL